MSNQSKKWIDTKDKPGLLFAMMRQLAFNSHISFEGSLKHYSETQYLDSEIRWLKDSCSTYWGGVSDMAMKRKRHSAEFKAKVALEAGKGVATLQELAKEFQVHPAQITTWKKQLAVQVASLFQRGPIATSLATAEELR